MTFIMGNLPGFDPDEEENSEQQFPPLDMEDDVDPHAEDAVDFFALCLLRRFSEIEMEPIATRPWRKGWEITVPPQFTQHGSLTKFAVDLQERIYFEKDYLVSFRIKDGVTHQA